MLGSARSNTKGRGKENNAKSCTVCTQRSHSSGCSTSADTPGGERRSAPIRVALNESMRFIYGSICSHCIHGISQAWFLHFLVHRRLEVWTRMNRGVVMREQEQPRPKAGLESRQNVRSGRLGCWWRDTKTPSKLTQRWWLGFRFKQQGLSRTEDKYMTDFIKHYNKMIILKNFIFWQFRNSTSCPLWCWLRKHC